MNLTDLQVELRLIEEHIEALHTEIEKMKPQTEEEKKTDFEQITKLAENHKIVNRSILGAPMETKKLIFSSMSYILLLEEKYFYTRILYLCRLSKGCGFAASAEDLYKIGLEFELDDLHKLCNDIAEYKYPYLVELFIMANISEEASVSIISIIADLAESFDVGKEEIKVLGMMAKAILINDIDYMLNMPVPSKNMWSGRLRDYINEEWIVEHRILCAVICTKKYKKIYTHPEYSEEIPCVIKNRMQAGAIVKKDDIICEYAEKNLEKNGFLIKMLGENIQTEKKITSPCDGVVYFVEIEKSGDVKEQPDEYIAVYVVSYFDDYTEFSTWYKKKFNA